MAIIWSRIFLAKNGRFSYTKMNLEKNEIIGYTKYIFLYIIYILNIIYILYIYIYIFLLVQQNTPGEKFLLFTTKERISLNLKRKSN